MDSGYINEVETVLSDDEGGQLKTKNGQKYIINHRIQDGFYVTKPHAILIAVLIAIVMAAFAILIYFLVAQSCTGQPEELISQNNHSNSELKASLFAPIVDKHESTPSNIGITPSTKIDDTISSPFKLNEGWSPTFYTLVMEPHIEDGFNNGHLVIDIVKDESAKGWPKIILDINNITIETDQVSVNQNNGTSVAIKSGYGFNNDSYEIEVLNATETTLQVEMKFISQLSDTLQGFYRVNYKNTGDSEQKWLVSTQFSPVDARRAFPCFDRPDKKASFKISLIREEKRTMSLSNMPSIRVTAPKPGYIREDYDVTPKMSTYLVAFMVTDLIKTNTSQSLTSPSRPEINIWSRKDAADMTQFAFDKSRAILAYFEKYFDIPFKLPKIDIVAVPDFGYNAMENWGLITFRESALLVPADEENRSSAEHIEHVAGIIGHEIAHQWFGNLVTMKWWDDLWLKEGFATFMSYVALDELEPTWKHLDFLSINELQKAMHEDSDLTSHPISLEVSKPADIRRIFDPISYSKGASIIRMMQSFLGENAFRYGLKTYLEKFQYSNAVHDDLWDTMTDAGHKYQTLPKDMDVKDIMDSWTLQAGYPVLNVIRNGTSISISQQRYLLPELNEKDAQFWNIPITYTTQTNPDHTNTIPSHWLRKSENITLDDVVEPEHWFYFNVRRAGYYRVNYDYKSWLALNRNFEKIPDVIIAQLLDDTLNLARAEVISYDIPLGFLMKLRYQDVLPWAAATPGIDYLTTMLIREPAYEHFRAFMRYIIRPIYNEMGFNEKPTETHIDLIHRTELLKHACFFNVDSCVYNAQSTYREWMRDKTTNMISPNIKDMVYCIALREGSFQEWYFAYNRYLETTSASEKELILDALGCTTKPWLLSKYLNMTVSATSGIRKQDGRRAFTAVAKNSIGSEIAFEFLMTNIKEINDYFGDGFSTLSKMIDSITIYMNKEYHLQQLEQFKTKAENLGLKSVEGSIQLAVQKVKNNVFWRSRSYHKLHKFLTTLFEQLQFNLY